MFRKGGREELAAHGCVEFRAGEVTSVTKVAVRGEAQPLLASVASGQGADAAHTIHRSLAEEDHSANGDPS